jgi:hypothetical protein
MKVDDLSWEYQPLENPDWDYARNLFTVLKRPQATWSQSVFSVRHENLIAPNRDYRCQGLCVFANSDYWKFLDAIFFGIKGVHLEPKGVIASPWNHTYRYSGDDTDVSVSYFLSRDNREGISGKVIFDVKNPFMKELIIKPLVDIRKINCDSDPSQTTTKVSEGCLTASIGSNSISFFVKNSSILAKKEAADWKYKLGSGFRQECNGVRFVPEHANPVFAGEMHKTVKGNERISLLISCNRKNSDFEDGDERIYANHIAKKFDCRKEVAARILSLNSFGIFQGGTSIPEAGDFWFRQIWLRDLIEAMLSNFHTLSRIDSKRVEDIMAWILKQQDKRTGIFPNFKGNYNSIDSSLLFFILAEKYLEHFKDRNMEKKISESFDILLKRLTENKIESGLPAIKDGMLYCHPSYSWTDSKVDFNGRMVSTRIPFDWLNENYDSDKQALLPEINAMLIRFLKFGVSLEKDTNDSYKKSIEAYKIFKSKDFLYSLVSGDRKDPTESSMALVSSVLLDNHVFNKDDLERMWPSVEKLLVRREGKLFGILCRNVRDRTYFNDYQYHGAVVWPRDTPYLINYLRIIGKNNLIKELLDSNLEHQMKEGAIFYSGELFSLPQGNNPSPMQGHSNPVPVKNPIQLWSNFCDYYIRE